MSETTDAYAFQAHLDLSFEEAVEAITAALKEEGFGILTEIDVKKTFKKKLDVDFRKYVILGACNPKLAHQALSTEIDVGLLLPCNVIVYEGKTGSVVGIADPDTMLGTAGLSELDEVAAEARSRLQRVIAALPT